MLRQKVDCINKGGHIMYNMLNITTAVLLSVVIVTLFVSINTLWAIHKRRIQYGVKSELTKSIISILLCVVAVFSILWVRL